jgi:hypothetical protein
MDTVLLIESRELNWSGLARFRNGKCYKTAPVWNIYYGATIEDVKSRAQASGYTVTDYTPKKVTQ